MSMVMGVIPLQKALGPTVTGRPSPPSVRVLPHAGSHLWHPRGPLALGGQVGRRRDPGASPRTGFLEKPASLRETQGGAADP